MAGTPTPNYQFPTYAETDTPNLAGAYNQAVNAIDAKIKEVADTISSGADVPDANSTTKGIAKLYDSTTVGAGTQDDGGITPNAVTTKVTAALASYAPKFTATAPITYSDNQIGIRYSNPAADGAQNGYGAVQVTGKQSDVANANSLTTATVPNVKAVKDYVDAKVPTEQQAYTATAPITVDASSRAIGINPVQQLVDSNYESFLSAMQENQANAKNYGGSSYGVVEGSTVANAIYAAHDNAHNWPAAFCVPNLNTVMQLVLGTFKGIAPIVIDNGNKTISVSVARNASTSGGSTSYDTPGTVRVAGNQQTLIGVANDSTGGEHSNEAGKTVPNCYAVNAFVNSQIGSDRTANLAGATQQLTVDMLSNLWVNPTTGFVFYKAPTE